MDNQHHFHRSLSLTDSTLLVIGSMIGSGIFIVSADMTRNVGSAGWLIAVWIITGLMTMIAAISYGELGGMFPKAGGQYVYLKEAYNKFIGFLYGWSFFAVIQTGTIAAGGVAFAKFAAYLVPSLSEDHKIFKLQTGVDACNQPSFFSVSAAQVVAIILIVLLTLTNTRGIKGGKIIQNIFTSAKLLSLFGLILAGIFMFRPDIWDANWMNTWAPTKTSLIDACSPEARFTVSSTSGAG